MTWMRWLMTARKAGDVSSKRSALARAASTSLPSTLLSPLSYQHHQHLPLDVAASTFSPISQRSFSVQTSAEHKSFPTISDSIRDRQFALMRDKAQEIVRKTPLGEMDIETWLEVEEQLRWWANQRTHQSVRISFLLMERLVEEQTVNYDRVEKISSFLNRDMMYALVVNWQQVYKSQPRGGSPQQDDQRIIAPQALLREIDRICQQSVSPQLQTTSGKALTVILDAALYLCKQTRSLQTAAFCEAVWDRMVALHYENNGAFLPTVSSLNCVLSAWSYSVRPDRAQALLENVRVVRPNNRSYNILLAAYARVGNGEAAERLLQDMCQQWQIQQETMQRREIEEDDAARPSYDSPSERSWFESSSHDPGNSYDTEVDDDDEDIRPDIVTWNSVISAWAKSGTPQAPMRAQSLLSRMYDPHTVPSVKPDLRTLNTVLSCWSRSAQEDQSHRCLRLLQQMKELYAVGELESPPDAFSYSTVLNAYAKSGQPEQVEELFNEMYLGFMHQGRVDLKPNLAVLTSLLEAWARGGRWEQAELVMKRIRELHELGFLRTGPDLSAYNVMFACYFHLNEDIPDAAARADALLKEMRSRHPNVRPDIRSLSFVLQTWLKTPDGRDQAVALIPELMNCYSEGSAKTQPDYDTIKNTILALCRAGLPDHARDIILHVCELSNQRKSPPPDIAVFGSVVAAWRKSKDPERALKADSFVKTMKQRRKIIRQRPDFRLYRTLVSCFAESNHLDGAAQRALEILTEMRKVAKKREAKLFLLETPDYNRVLGALAQVGLASEADDLLRQFAHDFESNWGKASPNTESYNLVLEAWARQDPPSPDAVDRAEKLFREMKENWMSRCTIDSYNSLLRCWAYSGRPEAVDKINELLDEMNATLDQKDAVKPNGTSYGCLVKALVGKNNPAEAESAIKMMWDDYTEGNVEMRPEPQYLDLVEEAWANSADSEKTELFREFRERIKVHEAQTA